MTVYIEAEDLEAGIPHILDAPSHVGTVELVVRRPVEGERELLDEGVLDLEQGLVGDRWRPARTGDYGGADDGRAAQITLMNARVIDLVAGDRDRWALAGDQLYVDFDLRVQNLPPGTRLEVGSAVLEVSDLPHTGCAKFTARFGSAATRFVNGKPNRELRLRGMNTRIVTPGTVHPGDAIRKL
jgi:MOSC domain-containing protein YiiM